MRVWVYGLFAVMFLLGKQTDVFAQKNGVDQEWNPSSAGPITTWTAPLCEKGKLVAQPFLFYTRTNGTFDDEGHRESMPQSDKKEFFQQQILLQYGLTNHWEVNFQTVYQETHVVQDDASAYSKKTGDSYFFARYCPLEETKWSPHVTGIYQLKIPTGKFQKADENKLGGDIVGGGSYDNGLGIIMTKRLKPFIVHLDAIYNIPFETKIDGVRTQYANYLNYDFGFEYFLPRNFNLLLEFNGLTQGDRKDFGDKIPATDVSSLTIVPGIGWSCDKVQTLLAYQRVIGGTNTDANDSVVLTVVYNF